jgi:hypothetical protein
MSFAAWPNSRREEQLRAVAAPAAPSLTWGEGAGYFALALLLDLVMGLPKLGDVARGDLIGPDSYMRLDRLRNILAHRAPLDIVARDGSGTGTVIHWSHLLDSIILLLAAPLRFFMDAPHAVHWAAVALGPLSTAFLGLALAWVLAPLVERGWRWTAPLLAALSPAIIGYGIAGIVHHHILVALVVVMTAGWAGRAALGYGESDAAWRLGAWAGAGLWLSPETVPFSLLAYGALGLAWLVEPPPRARGEALRNSASAFLLVTAAAFAVNPPEAGYGARELLHVSVVYLLLAVALAAVGWSVWCIDRWRLPPLRRGALGIGAALAAGGLWAAAFPQLLAGPSGVFGAAAASAYFGVIAEMQPVTTMQGFCAYLLDGAIATLIAAIIAWRARSLWWGYGAFCGALILALAQRHVRFATYPEAFAAALLPVLLGGCSTVFARYPERATRLMRIGVLGAFLLAVSSGGIFAARAAPARASAEPSCSLEHIGTLLAPYGGEVVLADVGLTPELLHRTRVLTVGSFYTNIAGFMRARAAWRSSPGDRVPEALAATRASLLLFCRERGRSPLVADLPPNTLFDRLNRGQVPRWLAKLGADPASGYVLYRIDGSGGGTR